MRIYLDMCCLQRPLDDKTQLRVAQEADAVIAIIALCESGAADLISSVALVYETTSNPYATRRALALGALERASVFIEFSTSIEQRATSLTEAGIKPLDALHVACAIEAAADCFCTCDDRLLNRLRAIQTPPIRPVNPLQLITGLST